MQKKKYIKNNLTLKDLPGDKSITHRLLFMAALISKKSTIINPNLGLDVLSTIKCLKKLGVQIKISNNKKKILVKGKTLRTFPLSNHNDLTLDCQNSGTTIRHLIAMLVSTNKKITLQGDKSLIKRPMARIIDPLKSLGANIEYKNKTNTPPVIVSPPIKNVEGGKIFLNVASAQVKSALLFYSLIQKKKMTISGKIQSRNHTEKLFKFLNIPIQVSKNSITVNPEKLINLSPFTISVPADPSAYLYYMFLFSTLKKPGSTLKLPNVYYNPTRCHSWDLLKMAGYKLIWEKNLQNHFEETGTLYFSNFKKSGSKFNLTKKFHPFVIDEIPLLMTWALFLDNASVFFDEPELRIKESDRLKELKSLFQIFGITENWIEQKKTNTIKIIPIKNLNNLQYPKTIFSSCDHRLIMIYHCLLLLSKDGKVQKLKNKKWIKVSNPMWDYHLSEILNCF